MNILVTGSAGFIGSQLCLKLLDRGDNVLGIDNLNDYYNVELKKGRLDRHLNHQHYTHYDIDIASKEDLEEIFATNKIDVVVNLAAQAGVRYSIENPDVYIESNIVGFMNILECSRHNKISNLVYASSSSVYGANLTMPFSVHDNVDHPLSLYAATKKSNELMAHTYSNLFNLSTTGLRFFTVYGPWGRPDMALFKFTKAIMNGDVIDVYNYGNHQRDFTYIEDIVEGLVRVIDNPAKANPNWDGNTPDPGSSFAPWKVYNIGSNNPVKLNNYIEEIEKNVGKKAITNLLPLQPGDVVATYADVEDLFNTFNFKPKFNIQEGVKNFVEWFKQHPNF
ncbi:NAD-dependent epimerase [Gammaproteobacteria bacterium]|nr:NAD-dependent epimerase [Gammaproteobacteria bacterium]